MKRLLFIVFGVIAGFAIFAVCAYGAIELFSSNRHDRSVEAIMTAVFVAGPLGGIVGAIVGVRLSRGARPDAAA